MWSAVLVTELLRNCTFPNLGGLGTEFKGCPPLKNLSVLALDRPGAAIGRTGLILD